MKMDLRSPKGSKVKFLNKNGYELEPRNAIKLGLIEGKIYTVKKIEIQHWTSYVYLEEFPNKGLNTTMFENVKDGNL